MNFFETVSSNMTKAVDFVVEKNRKAAMMNRLRIVIKNERENESRAFVALGKYYYEHLRDSQTEETEHLCRAVDFSDRRIKKAFAKMDEIAAPEDCEECCGDDCGCCAYSDDPEDAEEPGEPDLSGEICDEDDPSVSCIVRQANEAADAAQTDIPGTDTADEEAADDDQLFPPSI